MSAPLLLIDGYNLLHAAGMAQSEYRPGDLLRCRMRLLRLLHEKLSAAETRGTTVVFDARDPPPDRPAQVVVSGIRVLFASAGGDADALIQEWLVRHPAPRRVMLVSSDKALQRAARSCGAKFIGSGEFLDDLDRRRAASSGLAARAPADEKPAAHLSPSQTAYWLGVFGDAPAVEPDVAEPDVVVPDAVEPDAVEPDVADEPTSAAVDRAPPKAQPPSRSGRRPRRAKAAHLPHDAKPSPRAASEELDYWMKVFGGSLSGSSAASPDELRLADLEDWLKGLDGGKR